MIVSNKLIKLSFPIAIILFFAYFYMSGACLKLPNFVTVIFESIIYFIQYTLYLFFKTQFGLIVLFSILLIYIFYEFFSNKDKKKEINKENIVKSDRRIFFVILNFFLIINPIPSKSLSIKIYNKYFGEAVFKKISNKFAESFYENRSTLLYALYIAIIIRSLFLQPFYIPSSSMEPNLLVGDRLFVTKYSYGYSKHSFPFSPNIFSGRFLFSKPNRGDVVVFKTPADNRTDYIKRLIGLPGDEIQFIEGDLYINSNQVLKTSIKLNDNVFCGNDKINVNFFEEKLTNGRTYNAAYRSKHSFKNSDKFLVPENHYFFLGDNRDCSKDSRFLLTVGYVHEDNLVGKAQFLFFSSDTINRSIFNFWKCVDKSSLRANRFFKRIN